MIVNCTDHGCIFRSRILCGILNSLPFIKMILWRSGMPKFAVANNRVNQDQIVKRSAVLHVCVQNKKNSHMTLRCIN